MYEKRGSVKPLPSVALIKAKERPCPARVGQSISPCQEETSTPRTG